MVQGARLTDKGLTGKNDSPSMRLCGYAPLGFFEMNAMKIFFCAVSSLMIALFLTVAIEGNEGIKPPNIVVILADDLGWGDVGWHGSEIKTPNLDRLAESGAKLEQFYVQPVCSPTRAAFMTGRYPMRYGLQVGVIRPTNEFGLPTDERTLAEALRETGYFTAICGKWHLGERRPEYLPLQRGFDHHYGLYLGAMDYYTHNRDGGLDWHRNGKPIREEGYATDLLATEAVHLIREHNTAKPLFLYVPFNAVHSPFQPPQEDRFNEPYTHMKSPRREYAAMIASMDENIGRILTAIRDKGIKDNTIVFFSSDNGGPDPKRITSNGPLRGGKHKLYEGGIRVAACVAWQGKIKPNSTVVQPMHIVDLYPTFIGLAGGSLKQSKPIDGFDMKDALLNDKVVEREILHNASVFTGALRQGDWKIVINGQVDSNELLGPDRHIDNQSPAERKIEVFNIKEDPYERNDLSPSNPEKRRTLWDRYQWYARQAVPHLSVPDRKDFKAPEVWGNFD